MNALVISGTREQQFLEHGEVCVLLGRERTNGQFVQVFSRFGAGHVHINWLELSG